MTAALQTTVEKLRIIAGAAWVDYRNNRGEVVHFEFDGGA